MFTLIYGFWKYLFRRDEYFVLVRSLWEFCKAFVTSNRQRREPFRSAAPISFGICELLGCFALIER